MSARARTAGIASLIVLALLAAAPFIAPLLHVDISIVNEVLLDALAASSVNLMLGYTGLPAFGNAAFFGLGAYGAGLSIKYLNVGLLEAAAIGTIAAFVGSLLLGPFLVRRRGIYFGLLAIAFGQVFYFVAYRFTDITGGEDGMQFARPAIAHGLVLHSSEFYYFCLAIFAVVMAGFWALINSPFGHTLVAIRQNETRVRYLGLNSDRFVFVALVIGATMAGLGGALYGLLINFAYPLLLDWHASGDFVLMTVLGGAGTMWGPLLGAMIYVVGKDIVSTITPVWQIFIGALFVACVLGFPRGILGTAAALARRRGAVDDPSAESNAAFDPQSPLVAEVPRG